MFDGVFALFAETHVVVERVRARYENLNEEINGKLHTINNQGSFSFVSMWVMGYRVGGARNFYELVAFSLVTS